VKKIKQIWKGEVPLSHVFFGYYLVFGTIIGLTLYLSKLLLIKLPGFMVVKAFFISEFIVLLHRISSLIFIYKCRKNTKWPSLGVLSFIYICIELFLKIIIFLPKLDSFLS